MRFIIPGQLIDPVLYVTDRATVLTPAEKKSLCLVESRMFPSMSRSLPLNLALTSVVGSRTAGGRGGLC